MGNRSKYLPANKNSAKIIVAIVSGIIFLIGSVLMLRNEAILLWLIPLGLVIVFLALFSIDKFLLLTVFLVPLSIQLRFIVPDTSSDIFLPTEIMLFMILILMIFKVFVSREIKLIAAILLRNLSS